MIMPRSRAHQIVGDSDHRQNSDFYVTPPGVTEALFEREKFDGWVWECACGNGSMSQVIERYNYCYSSDIRNKSEIYSKGFGNIDFLTADNYEIISNVDNIITNPPYRHALKFVEKAKSIATHKVAMLLKLVFLEGITRYDMFQDTAFPLMTVYVFSRRVTIRPPGEHSGNTGMIAFAWFVWNKRYNGLPMIEWISDKVD